MTEFSVSGLDIAVIGMAGRFPGARDIYGLWENLKNAIESIRFFTDEELRASGVTPAELENPNYVKAYGTMEDCDIFDASFFGYTPKEAEVMDPQIRIFHECAWAALEDAGYAPGTHHGSIGLYAGATPNFNWEALSLLSGKRNDLGDFSVDQLAKKDYLTLRVSYKLDLSGPSFVLYTACSTSLVAIHLACQAILNGECDMALAGGVTVSNLNNIGYLYQEGMVASPDGHCRAFDARAKGIVGGNGAGIVVLKRQQEAIAHGDHIYALVKGSAVNNDGIRRAGFTAPSIEGQANVIKMALQAAEVDPETIGYIEAHGTATALGDPVEIEGLKLAFNTGKKAFCALGSIKTNVGHLDTAAGAAGFIKTVLALKHRLIPPTLHFQNPNPTIDFIDSPFYINSKLSVWENPGGKYPRRAGVSAFGIGGTNAHVILEECSEGTGGLAPLSNQLILLSAKTKTALERMKENLAKYLKENENPAVNLANTAYTLQVGRNTFKHRWMAVCLNRDEVLEALTSPGAGELHVVSTEEESTAIEPIQPAPDKPSLLQTGRLWLHGHNPDWKTFYSREKRSRVPLPTYPFEGQHFPIASALINLRAGKLKNPQETQTIDGSDISNWCYLPTWKRSVFYPPKRIKNHRKFSWLVFGNELSLSQRLVEKLEQDNQQVTIGKAGERFSQSNQQKNLYTLNPRERRDYEAFFNELHSQGKIPDKIVHLWSVTNEANPRLTRESFDRAQYMGFFSLLYIAKTIAKLNISSDIDIILVTDHLQEVLGEKALCPEKAPGLGLLKAIPQEFPGLVTRAIDILVPGPGSSEETELIDTLLEEFTTNPPEPLVAYRDNQRWLQVFEPFPLAPELEAEAEFRKQGVYLITGGLGFIGFIFSKLFARESGARLILTGRSPFPGREEWDTWLKNHEESHPVSLKIKKLQQLERMGAEVLYLQADAADPVQMRQAITRAEAAFGPINGVIHAAGIIEGKSMRTIQELTDEDCRLQFETKVYALMVLDELFKEKEPDFFWVMSSISCVLAGLGFGAYASANLFMDAFIKKHNQWNGKRNYWSSLNWDGMREDWSLSLFKRMFALGRVDQIVASVGGNLQGRIDRWIKLKPVREAQESGGVEKGKAAPAHPRPALSTDYVPPRDPTEAKVANIWKSLLGYDEIGVHDDFLELGGDSLKSITVISKIHQELNVNIPVTEFFSKATVEKIAQYISTGKRKDTYVSVEPVEKKELYPVSSIQRRLFFIQQLNLENTGYNLFYILSLPGVYEKEKLEETFKKLIARHESLRTSFEMPGTEPVQKIHEKVDFTLDCYHGSEEGAEEIKTRLDKPFDLSQPPLLRAAFVNVKSSQPELYFVMHHIITDGISWDILMNEFYGLYRTEKLSHLKLQYKDYAGWEKTQEQKETLKQQESFWLNTLSGKLPVLQLPTDYERPVVQSFAGNTLNFVFNRQETQCLLGIAKKADVTLYMTMLAIFNVLLSKLSGQEDIIVGTPIAGRQHADLMNIIGNFVNMLAIRNFVPGNKTFRAFLEEIKKRTLDAFSNQDYQFGNLVEKILEKRDPSHNPIFDVVFNMLGQSDAQEEDKDEDDSSVPGEKQAYAAIEYKRKTSQFDINCAALHQGNRVYFSIEYCTALFKKSTIERFFEYYKNILLALSASLEVKLSDIRMITKEEQQELFTITPMARSEAVK